MEWIWKGLEEEINVLKRHSKNSQRKTIIKKIHKENKMGKGGEQMLKQSKTEL